MNCVFYPAVARRESRLRFSVMASHTMEELDRAAQATAAAWGRCTASAVAEGAEPAESAA